MLSSWLWHFLLGGHKSVIPLPLPPHPQQKKKERKKEDRIDDKFELHFFFPENF